MEIPKFQQGGSWTNSNGMFVEGDRSKEIILRKTDMPNIICESQGTAMAKELPCKDKIRPLICFETLNTMPEDW